MVIIINRLLKITGTIGKSLTYMSLLILLSTGIISLKVSKEDNSNPFCSNKYLNEDIKLEYKEIKRYEYRYDCSTMYFDLFVDESLNIKEILSLLVSIGKQLKDYECFTHFEIFSDSLDKPIYATINLKTQEISYVGG